MALTVLNPDRGSSISITHGVSLLPKPPAANGAGCAIAFPLAAGPQLLRLHHVYSRIWIWTARTPLFPQGIKKPATDCNMCYGGSWWKWRHGETQMFKEMSFPGSKSDWQWSRKGNRKDYGPFPWIYWHTFCGILTDWKLLKLECRQHALSSRLPVVVCIHVWSTFKYKGLLP